MTAAFHESADSCNGGPERCINEPVRCMKPGCSVEWPRDPALEVECPECHAGVGARCIKPSGHRKWKYEEPHNARDILADEQGKYGPCPLGICGLSVAKRKGQLDLFPEA